MPTKMNNYKGFTMSDKKTFSENGNLTNPEKDELDAIINNAHDLENQRSIEISGAETLEAYQKVQLATSQKKTSDLAFMKYAVAALILIGVIGTAYIITPKSVTVPDGTTRTVLLSDGTTINLNSGSELTYPRWFNVWSRTVSLDGEAFFEVTPNGSPFRVETDNALVTVMGTKFNVRSWASDTEEKTSVFLQEGSVLFASKAEENKAIILEPGQLSSLSGKQDVPVQPSKTDQSRALAWMQNGLAFDNQPLSAIFSEISRRFDVQIETDFKRLANEKLTIYISEVKSVEQVLGDISRAKNLQYSKEDDVITISRSK